MAKQSFSERVDQRFHISARNSRISTEIVGGIATAMAMFYILPVSSGMYAAAGVDQMLVIIAIALVTCVISVLMGLVANVPIALSTGMGINAFAVYSICLGMGYSYELVMLCTLIEGIIFLILSLTGVRSGLIKALPGNLKLFIAAGIGGFILYIGAQNSHLIAADASTLTTLVNFRAEFNTVGISAVLALLGLFIMTILTLRGSKIAIIGGIIITWVLGMICQLCGIYVPNPEAGYYSLYPSLSLPHVSSLGQIFLNPRNIGAVDASMIMNIIIITCTMFYSDFFDTVGTCMACLQKIKDQMKDEIGKLSQQVAKGSSREARLHRMEDELSDVMSDGTTKKVLIMDAIGTCGGAICKCTTVTSFIESAVGIESGARTGLAAIVTGGIFFLAIFFASIFTTIPGFATGPALIMVGISMMTSALKSVEWDKEKMHEIIPGLLCFLFMVLSYNIANGMAAGIISYVLISLFCKKGREVSPLMYIFAILLIAKFALL